MDAFDRLGIDRQIGYDCLHLYSIVTHPTTIADSTPTLEENTAMFDYGIVLAGKSLNEQLMNLDLMKAYDVAYKSAVNRTPLTPCPPSSCAIRASSITR